MRRPFQSDTPVKNRKGLGRPEWGGGDDDDKEWQLLPDILLFLPLKCVCTHTHTQDNNNKAEKKPEEEGLLRER